MAMIGVMSDTHGNIENMKTVAKLMLEQDVEWIIHLGDFYKDALELDSLTERVIKVPGVFSDEYQNPNIPNRLIRNFNGVKVLITHTKESHENDLKGDIKPEELVAEKKVDVVLYGHTHVYGATVSNGVLFVNPGHLQNEDKKGYPPTFAILDIEGRKVIVRILDMEKKAKLEETFNI